MPATAADTGRPAHRATSWDRLAILLLGTTGCALSYDALRQMATAIHTRPDLTYLFPVVIDGFIAYGVRALLVLRTAPLHARAYAWALFGTATVASIWANSLHAVRLNQPGATQLRLGDTTVGVLSTLAPLALAGATHLHILITRHGTTQRTGTRQDLSPTSETRPVLPVDAIAQEWQEDAPQLAEAPTQQTAGTSEEPATIPDSTTAPDCPQPRPEDNTAAQGARADSGQPTQPSRVGRPLSASLDKLTEIVHQAHPDLDQLTRASARKAITDRGLSVSSERLTEVLAGLRAEHGHGEQAQHGQLALT
jgi:hypothetical protein